MQERTFDIITLGRAGVDLYGEQVGSKLEDMTSFKKYVGGCPANIAIGSARLGLNAGIITCLGQDHMGRFIYDTFKKERVNTECVHFESTRLTGLVLLGIENQTTFPLIFYRENCADMALSEEKIDPDYIAQSKALLVTGTHFSTELTNRASRKAIIAAQMSNTTVILDIDYRPVLWGLVDKDQGENRFVQNEKVTQTLQTILPLCNLVVGTEEEFHIAAGTDNTVQALKIVRSMTDALLILKLGKNGCKIFDSDIDEKLTATAYHPGFGVNVLNVLGAGDAFISGFLSAWLNQYPLLRCAEFGNACGALVVSRHGCSVEMPSLSELELFLDNYDENDKPDSCGYFKHHHYASTQKQNTNSELFLLAFDHRILFEKLYNTQKGKNKTIETAKSLIANAAIRVAETHDQTGIIVDKQYGQNCIDLWLNTQNFIASPVEKAHSFPLEFNSPYDISNEIRQWPKKQAVKCLVKCHPKDPSELLNNQIEKLKSLYQITERLGHDLIIEVLPSPELNFKNNDLNKILTKFYQAHIYPTLWKLPPPSQLSSWKQLSKTIKEHDPFCQGVLLLGQNASFTELKQYFTLATKHEHCKGFAIGRTIFNDPLIQWFNGNITDGAFIDLIATQFRKVITLWNDANQSNEALQNHESSKKVVQ